MCNDERHTFMSTIKNIDCRLLDVTEIVLIKTHLFGNCSVDVYSNTQILDAKIKHMLTLFYLGGVNYPPPGKIGAGQRPKAPASELKFSFTCFLKFLKHFHVARPFYRRFVNDESHHIFLVLMES